MREVITNLLVDKSRLAWGGWIEIPSPGPPPLLLQSRLAWGGWIEIKKSWLRMEESKSRPARGGWIEIGISAIISVGYTVPPRTGRVD